MEPHPSIEKILELADQLSPVDRRELIARLSSAAAAKANGASALDDQYQRGYERIPEDTADVEAMLPHLPLSV